MSLIKDPLARPQCSSFLQLKACSWARRICAEEIYIMPNNMDEDGNYFYMPIIWWRQCLGITMRCDSIHELLSCKFHSADFKDLPAHRTAHTRVCGFSLLRFRFSLYFLISLIFFLFSCCCCCCHRADLFRVWNRAWMFNVNKIQFGIFLLTQFMCQVKVDLTRTNIVWPFGLSRIKVINEFIAELFLPNPLPHHSLLAPQN